MPNSDAGSSSRLAISNDAHESDKITGFRTEYIRTAGGREIEHQSRFRMSTSETTAQQKFNVDTYLATPKERAPYNEHIKSYDVHTYFAQSYEPQKKEAFELRERFQKDFASDIEQGEVRVFKFHDYPLGPHPYGMFEVDFHTPEAFAKVVPW